MAQTETTDAVVEAMLDHPEGAEQIADFVSSGGLNDLGVAESGSTEVGQIDAELDKVLQEPHPLTGKLDGLDQDIGPDAEAPPEQDVNAVLVDKLAELVQRFLSEHRTLGEGQEQGQPPAEEELPEGNDEVDPELAEYGMVPAGAKSYPTKGRGQPCKQGETSASDGCVPAGEGPKGDQKQTTKTGTQAAFDSPFGDPDHPIYRMTQEEFSANPPRGFVFDPSQKNEATAQPYRNRTVLGPKFFDLDADQQKYVLSHEYAHHSGIEDLAFADPRFWEAISRDQIFGPVDQETGRIIDGINGNRIPGENLVDGYTLLFSDPEYMDQRFPKAKAWIIAFAKKHGIPVPSETKVKSLRVWSKAAKDPHPVRHGGPCRPGERADMTGCTPKKGPPKRGFPHRGVNEKPNVVRSPEKQKLRDEAHKLVKEMYARLKEGKAPTKAQFKQLGEGVKHLSWETLRSLHDRMVRDDQVMRKRHRVKALLAYAKKATGTQAKLVARKPAAGRKPSPKQNAARKQNAAAAKKLPPKAKKAAGRFAAWAGRLARGVGKAALSGPKLAASALLKAVSLVKGHKAAGKKKPKKPGKAKPTPPKLPPPAALKRDADALLDDVAGGLGNELSPKEKAHLSLNLIAWLMSLIGIDLEGKYGR